MQDLRRRLQANLELARAVHGPGSIVRLLTSFNARTVLSRIGGAEVLKVTVTLEHQGRRADFRILRKSDYSVLREVFVRLEYDVDVHPEPRTIVDLGSNTGLSSLFFHLKYPNADIHAVEADPITYQALVANVGDNPRITPHNLAVTSEDGPVRFYRTPDATISSSIFARSKASDTVEVDGVSLDSFLDRIGVEGVDLIKCDIEGAEYLVFEHFRGTHRLRRLIGEVHPDLANRSSQEFIDLFPPKTVTVLREFGRRLIVDVDVSGQRA